MARTRKRTQKAQESDLQKTPPRGSSRPARPEASSPLKKRPRTTKGKKEAQPINPPTPDDGVDVSGGNGGPAEPAEPAEYSGDDPEDPIPVVDDEEDLLVITVPSPLPVRPAVNSGATRKVPVNLADPILRSSATPNSFGTPAPSFKVRDSATPALGVAPGGKPPRVKWTETMEEVLLQALEEIVKRGKTADSFKAEH